MAEASLKLGGSWATKEGSLLGFNDQNGNYKPIPFDFTRATTATRVNRDGLIEEVQAGVPRIDFTDSAGSLLLEPQRTNYLINSDNGSSYTTFSAIKTLNEVISLDGTLNSFTLEGNGDYNQILGESPFVTLPSAGDYTFSVFAKKGNNNFIQLFFNGFTGATNTEAYFDLENGTTPTSGASIDDYGNGWYRCSFVGTVVSGDLNGKMGFRISNTNSNFFFPTANDTIGKNGYFYGFQLEAGSYPTSYIKTSGSAVTRNADDCTNADVSSLLGSGTGTAFIDLVVNGEDTQGNIPLTIGTGTANLVYLWILKPNRQIRYEAYTSGTLQGLVTTNTGFYTFGDRIKVALVWADNDFAMYINGTLIGTDTSGTAPTPTKLWLGQYTGGNYKGASISQVSLFPTRLTNAELAELTS